MSTTLSPHARMKNGKPFLTCRVVNYDSICDLQAVAFDAHQKLGIRLVLFHLAHQLVHCFG